MRRYLCRPCRVVNGWEDERQFRTNSGAAFAAHLFLEHEPRGWFDDKPNDRAKWYSMLKLNTPR